MAELSRDRAVKVYGQGDRAVRVTELSGHRIFCGQADRLVSSLTEVSDVPK